MSMQREGIAKITWDDEETSAHHEHVLVEGATASIGRANTNDICVPGRHVSRQHAVISFRDGIFMISDLGSANGTFVNDRRLSDPFPLAHGDIIRLYVPILHFSAVVTEEEEEEARKTGTLIVPVPRDADARLVITAGPQEGNEFVLDKDTVTIGRLAQGATWEISLQDRAVSRPHCRFVKRGTQWTIADLNSANGSFLNGTVLSTDSVFIKDGDVMLVGETTLLFRAPQIPQTSKL